MKKRIASLLLALCMALSVIPATVLADDFPIYIIGGNTEESVCDHSGNDNSTPAVENKADAGCEAAGSYDAVIRCSDCGAELSRETVAVPAKGHSYENGVCTGCGDVKAVPAVTYAGSTLSYEEYVSVVNLYSLSGMEGVNVKKDAGVMMFTAAQYSAWDKVSFVADRATAGLTWSEQHRCYYAKTAPIAISDLYMKHYYVGYAKLADGTYVFSDAKLYGPTSYAYNILADASADQKTRDLCVAMLNYIAAVQKYLTPGTAAADLANAGLTAEQKTLDWTNPQLNTAPAVDAAIKGVRDKDVFTATGKNLHFGRNVSVIAIYKVSDSLVNGAAEAGTVFWTQEQYEELTKDLTQRPSYGSFGECTVVPLTRQSNGQWASYSSSVPAKDIADTTIYYMGYLVQADGTVKYTTLMSYNIEQYIASKGKNTNALGELCKALYYYERAAKAVFA